MIKVMWCNQENIMCKKILLFKAKIICYSSNEYFTDCFIDALINAGCDVDLCDISMEESFNKEEEMEKKLELLMGKNYDAIIDFNSILPRIRLDDGSFFLDYINGPFYDYIVDHPLYHHPILNLQLKNYNVICLDKNHADYIKEFYPHIKKVIFMPIPAMKSMSLYNIDSRKYDVVFQGTYTSCEQVMCKYRSSDEQINQYIKELIDLMINDTSLDIKHALDMILKRRNIVTDKETYRCLLNKVFPADMYIRAFFREELMKILIGNGIDINVFGYGWEQFPLFDSKHFKYHEAVGYAVSVEMMGNTKIMLNMMPWFKAGSHDRVFSSMINGCVCVTDSSSYIDELFEDGKHLVKYSLGDMQKLPEIIKLTLSDTKKMNRISCKGAQIVEEKYTWNKMAAVFLNNL